MTREKAISWLKELTWHEGEDVPIYDEDVEAIKMGIKALEQKPKWIPVTEGLPEKDGLYLVSVKNDNLRRYSKTCWYSDKNWFARHDVVAWQPLPQPYKAESEGVEE